MNLEKVIAEEIAKAKEYKAQANSGWSFFPHKKLSYLECERNRYYAERHNQIAAWLQELVERRKKPEIVRCGECKQKSFCPSKIDCGNGLDYVINFCSNGKRAGEEN